jgi:HEPN domain.
MTRTNISAYVNTFATRAFRDIADQDYILARIAFRYELDLQFITSSQQAIEKYLKAILLFNRRDTKRLEHNLSSAYRAVLEISDIPFTFSAAVPKFVEYLDDQASRYFEFSFHVYGDRLRQLDETVWHLRKWCTFLRGTVTFDDGRTVEMLPFEIAKRQLPLSKKQPYKFRDFSGFLEDVLDRKRHRELRPFLVWSNPYFSRVRKPSYRLSRHSAANTMLSMHPDILPELERYVKFSKELKRRVKEWSGA